MNDDYLLIDNLFMASLQGSEQIDKARMALRRRMKMLRGVEVGTVELGERDGASDWLHEAMKLAENYARAWQHDVDGSYVIKDQASKAKETLRAHLAGVQACDGVDHFERVVIDNSNMRDVPAGTKLYIRKTS